MNAKSAYSEKLRDPRWQKKRLEVMQRDDFTCQSCCDSESTLNVHHCYYEKGKEPWDYTIDSLLTLCQNCHSIETESLYFNKQELLNSLSKKGLFSHQYRELAEGILLSNLRGTNEPVVSAISWALRTPQVIDAILEAFFESLKGAKNAKS